MSFTTVTITHQFQNADGSPAIGEVEFSLTKGMTNSGLTILPIAVTADLDGEGNLSQTLVSNLDAGTNPQDSYWRVDLRLTGIEPQTYFIQVPVGSGTVGLTGELGTFGSQLGAFQLDGGVGNGTIDLGTLLPTEGTTIPIETTPIWQSYLDVQRDVKPWLQLPVGQRKYDKALTDITGMACEWVQNYLGRPVAPTQFFRRFDGWTGWQGVYLELPYYPVIGPLTVTEYWGTSGPHTLSEQTPTQQSNNNGGDAGDVYQVDRLKGRLTRAFPGLLARPWFPGYGNIEVTWVAGYNPLPKDIRQATLELANYWYRNTQEAERVASPQMEYEEAGPSNLWAAVPNRVTALLEAYTQVGIG